MRPKCGLGSSPVQHPKSSCPSTFSSVARGSRSRKKQPHSATQRLQAIRQYPLCTRPRAINHYQDRHRKQRHHHCYDDDTSKYEYTNSDIDYRGPDCDHSDITLIPPIACQYCCCSCTSLPVKGWRFRISGKQGAAGKATVVQELDSELRDHRGQRSLASIASPCRQHVPVQRLGSRRP